MICSSATVTRLLLTVAGVVLVAGCGKPPLLVPVKGVVLLDGRPLESGVVQFQPAAGQLASGVIAGDGTFTLSRHLPDDGVPPGTYRVAVTAFDPRATEMSVDNLIVPVRYTRFGSSGIELTIFPGSVDPLVIALSSASDAAGERLPSRLPPGESAAPSGGHAFPVPDSSGGHQHDTSDTRLGGA